MSIAQEWEASWIERMRKALMESHAHDWDMETISEAAHVCAHAMTVYLFGVPHTGRPNG